MAYHHGSIYREQQNATGRVLCNDCGRTSGEIEFSPNGQQLGLWTWHRRWGGIVSIPPEEWPKWGIDPREGEGRCHRCNEKC